MDCFDYFETDSDSDYYVDSDTEKESIVYQQQRDFVTKYTLGPLLGTGGFTKGVIKCTENSTGISYAAKVIDKYNALWNGTSIELEIEILKQLNHPNIIKYKEHVETVRNIIIITELVEGKTLIEMIYIKPFSETDIRFVMQRLLTAIEYMHENNIVHRDISPKNIMVILDNQDNIIDLKLCDLGIADIGQHFNIVCGTDEFCAPEVKYLPFYDKKVDVYSAGKVMHFMLVNQNELKILIRIIEQNKILHKLTAAEDICMKMSAIHPNDRLSASDALDHNYFKDINVVEI